MCDDERPVCEYGLNGSAHALSKRDALPCVFNRTWTFTNASARQAPAELEVVCYSVSNYSHIVMFNQSRLRCANVSQVVGLTAIPAPDDVCNSTLQLAANGEWCCWLFWEGGGAAAWLLAHCLLSACAWCVLGPAAQ